MVKAQVPVGGRGKAGGIVRCDTRASVEAAVTSLLGSRLKGHAVDACLLEAVAVGQERYLAIMVDPASYGLRVIYSARGGVEVEQTGSSAARLCPPHPGAVAEVLADLIAGEPDAWRDTVAAIGKALAEMLLTRELALAEINPLFVSEAGCVAADAKVVVDLNAIDRQSRIAEMIAARPAIYVDACRKIARRVRLCRTRSAGRDRSGHHRCRLSMMLIDELTARGVKPLNFCDIRTGQMRGSPARLIRVLEWITARPSLRRCWSIFSPASPISASSPVCWPPRSSSRPRLRVPVVARLVGRNAAEAQRILAEAQPGMLVTENLAEALARIDAIVGTAS